MPHGDAVGDGDGGELARRAARRRDAAFGGLRLARERNVAGRGLVPRRRDADDRLLQLLFGDAHGIEHRTMRRALGTDRDMPARQLRLVPGGRFALVVRHGCYSGKNFRQISGKIQPAQP
jgi:hypothetical protein